MSEEEYEKYKEEHEWLPKWANLAARVLGPKPTDSTAMKVARFAGMVASPPVIAVGTLGAHAHDEIMYSPFTPFLSMPGRAQFAASKYLAGPKPAILSSPDKFRLPSRPVQFNLIPKRPSPAPLPFRPAPRVSVPWTPPAVSLPRLRPIGSALSNNSVMNNLRIAQPSWKLSMSNIYKPPAPSVIPRMKLVMPKLGSSLPFKPFVSNLHL
jgi:hypothetical protein